MSQAAGAQTDQEALGEVVRPIVPRWAGLAEVKLLQMLGPWVPAAVVPVLVGTAAGADGSLGAGRGIVAWRFVAALVVALAIQVSTNFANDYSDGVRGTDSEARVGPVRLVRRRLHLHAARRADRVQLGEPVGRLLALLQVLVHCRDLLGARLALHRSIGLGGEQGIALLERAHHGVREEQRRGEQEDARHAGRADAMEKLFHLVLHAAETAKLTGPFGSGVLRSWRSSCTRSRFSVRLRLET